MAESFVYDDTTAGNIISKVKFSSEFLHVPTNEFKSRDYERIWRKQVSNELHCSTLAEYYKSNRIPRGLRSNLRPTLFSDNPDFCTKFEGIINKCSFDIILLTIEFLQKALEENTDKIKAIEEQITASLSSEEWLKLKDKVAKTTEEFKKNTEIVKRQKFVRDAEDYHQKRVYRWQSPYFQRDYYRYQNHGASGSGSDSSNSSYNPHFLGSGRRRKGRQRGRREGARGNQYGEPGMLTRSQVPNIPTY